MGQPVTDWLNRFNTVPRVSVGGADIPIAIKRHPTARRLTMRVAPDGSEIRVTMPRWGQSREAIAFAASRREWLEQQLAAVQPRREPGHGTMLPFRGESHFLEWDLRHPRTPVLAKGSIQVGGPQANMAGRLERWLREQGLALMSSDLAHYCRVADVEAPAITLSRAQRRWG
ncbi:MAG: hypothetical protein B7X57_09615, partial [Erythrobacter sp. 34-65-8]